MTQEEIKRNKYENELRRLHTKYKSGDRMSFEDEQRAEFLLDWLEVNDSLPADIETRNKILGVGQKFNRKTVSDGLFKTPGEQLQAIARSFSPGGETDQRLFEVRTATGLSEGIGGDGGFLLQSDYSTDIFQTAWDEGQLAKMCKRVTIGRNANSIVIPGVDETSRVDGSRAGGTRAYYVAEAAQKTASQPKFRRIELNASKLVVLVYVTDELLEDEQALGDFVMQSAAKEIGFCMDRDIIRGTGAGRPLGIKNAGCTIDVGSEVGQPASTILYENVLAMWARLIPASHKSAVWLINQSCISQLYSMNLAIGAGGSACFVPSQMMTDGFAGYMFGRPVIAVEQCDPLGTSGDIILADLKNGYVIADKGTPKTDWSIHVRFIYDESIFRMVYRWDGQPFLGSAVTPYGSGDTLSHFLTLETRS